MQYPPTNPQMLEDVPSVIEELVHDVSEKVPVMYPMEGLSNRMEMPSGQGRTVKVVRLDHLELEARKGGFFTDWTQAPQRLQGESDVITLQMVGIYLSQEANLNFYTSAAHARQPGLLSTQIASALARVVDQALIQAVNASPRVNVSGGSTSDVIKAKNLFDAYSLIKATDDVVVVSPQAHCRDLLAEGVSRSALTTGKVNPIWGMMLSYKDNNIRRETGDHGKTIVMKKGAVELLHRPGIQSKWLTDDHIGEGQKGHLMTRTFGVRCDPWAQRNLVAIEDRKMDVGSAWRGRMH